MKAGRRTFPPWLTRRLPPEEQMRPVRGLLRDLHLQTVCREAHCPNMGECFARGTATFMILGTACTRHCRFCAVGDGEPRPPAPDEPERVAEAVRRMGLRHVVVTSVTRDDLPDGGSAHFARTIRAVHGRTAATVEVLTPDFAGRRQDVDRVLDAAPEVFNHNIETVPRLYADVRPEADYGRSLRVLARAASHGGVPLTKSGLMLGLGETAAELRAALADLRTAGCMVLTLGQYLSPSPAHYPVAEFIPPDRFRQWKEEALGMGFAAVASGPFVRSSYEAAQVAAGLLDARAT